MYPTQSHLCLVGWAGMGKLVSFKHPFRFSLLLILLAPGWRAVTVPAAQHDEHLLPVPARGRVSECLPVRGSVHNDSSEIRN